MFWVYALYNQKYDKIYVGQTESLKTRLILHETGIFKKSYTAKYDGEWNLIYKEEARDRLSALAREKQLKSFRGREFIKKQIKIGDKAPR